ncbi:MAG TPA: hypothetical protein VFJ30_07905 [Phycisphaerae bacterium]|nr:hypothetical protein [Phycisphaerae bacterium]
MRKTALFVLAVAFPLALGTGSAVADLASATGQVTSPPVSTVLTLHNSESGLLQVLNERQDVVLGSDLGVDLTASYLDSLGHAWNASSDGVSAESIGTIPAGTVVRSHLVHFDPVGSSYADARGTLTFDAPILGLMVKTTSLNASDFLGDPSYTYAGSLRDLENQDTVRFRLSSPSTLEITILAADIYIDEVRVITAPAPGAVLLGAMGLGLVGWLKRRRAAD